MRYLMPFALAALAGCNAITPAQQTDVAACAAALMASGQRDVSGLMQAAALSPACNRLAQDAVQAAVREALLRLPK